MSPAMAWLLVAALLPRVSIVAPRVTNYKEALRVECRVARHADNRWLWIGLADHTDSLRQIEGEKDRVVHELIVRSVPCETVVAYCLLVDQHGKKRMARQTVLVLPCSVEESP